MSRQLTLSLEIRPFPEVSYDDILEINSFTLHMYSALGKKPKKATCEIPIVLESTEPEEVVITAENLKDLESWYNFFSSPRSKNSRYLFFAKSATADIGSGFVSSHIHFSSFLLNDINEFLIVYVNKDNFDRLINGKALLPKELADVMQNSISGVTTVNEILNETVNQRRNLFTQMEENSGALETFSGEPAPLTLEESSPLTSIVVWKRYEILLFTLNNLFFSIDEQFMQIGRTQPLDYDLVKEICSQIMERHKQIDTTE